MASLTFWDKAIVFRMIVFHTQATIYLPASLLTTPEWLIPEPSLVEIVLHKEHLLCLKCSFLLIMLLIHEEFALMSVFLLKTSFSLRKLFCFQDPFYLLGEISLDSNLCLLVFKGVVLSNICVSQLPDIFTDGVKNNDLPTK